MKNGFVLVHHYGDDGSAPEGQILRDLTTKRFDELEKKGLIREATAKEVEAGYQPPFTAEEDAEGDALADGPAGAIEAARLEVAKQAQAFIDDLKKRHAEELEAEQGRAQEAEKALEKAHTEIAGLRATVAASVAGEKQAQAPANKQAPPAPNKSKGA